MGVLLLTTSGAGILAASFIAVAAIVVSIPARRPETRIDALLLSWVAPYFFITGAFEVKFLRYLLPIAPVLLLLGSRMLFDGWERVSGLGVRVRRVLVPIGIAVGAAAACVTVFYALAYMSVYASEHPGVRGAEWIRENVPQNSVILKEHWEEGLPGLHGYRILELPMYNDDRPHKVNQISDLLARADVLTLYSNRLYGTVPRLGGPLPGKPRVLQASVRGASSATSWKLTSRRTRRCSEWRWWTIHFGVRVCRFPPGSSRWSPRRRDPAWLRRRKLFGVRPSQGADIPQRFEAGRRYDLGPHTERGWRFSGEQASAISH